MSPPFKNFPLSIRLMLMFSMFLFNTAFISNLAFLSIHSLFGIESPEQVAKGVLNSTSEINAFLFIQGITSIGGFVLTAIMFSVLESGEFSWYLRLKNSPSLKMIALAILTILIAQFFIQFLVEVNGKIPLPPALEFLKELQKKNEDVTKTLLSFTSFNQFVITGFVMAVIPAIGEEMFFRGLILGDLLKAKILPVISIPISGLIFSVSHTQFQNLLAIWTLGCFLGYLYYISGSLWLPIIAHFANNFLEVLLKYLYNIGIFISDVTEISMPFYTTVVSVALFGICIFVLNRWKGDRILWKSRMTMNYPT